MKVLTIIGTRPELIRLCLIIKKLDGLCDQVLVHTGQNYDPTLNDVFFEQLGIRQPDYYLGATGSFSEQIGKILVELEKIVAKEKPDKFLVLGDTNSSMGAIVMKRLGIPVFHMEAGNRCYDNRVPEEVNRRIIDHSSDVLMPYTERSRMNLLHEGIEGRRIYVTGNPINEVLEHFKPQIDQNDILEKLGVQQGQYFLATVHRQENVDVPERLKDVVTAFNQLCEQYQMPLIWSVHPRTRKQLEQLQLPIHPNLKVMEPFGLFEFVKLEKNAKCVLSDSGTVQEECAIFKVPAVTVRDVTERPETIEVGSNMLSGVSPEQILLSVKTVLAQLPHWEAPTEYVVANVSDTVMKIVLGYRYTGALQS